MARGRGHRPPGDRKLRSPPAGRPGQELEMAMLWRLGSVAAFRTYGCRCWKPAACLRPYLPGSPPRRARAAVAVVARRNPHATTARVCHAGACRSCALTNDEPTLHQDQPRSSRWRPRCQHRQDRDDHQRRAAAQARAKLARGRVDHAERERGQPRSWTLRRNHRPRPPDDTPASRRPLALGFDSVKLNAGAAARLNDDDLPGLAGIACAGTRPRRAFSSN